MNIHSLYARLMTILKESKPEIASITYETLRVKITVFRPYMNARPIPLPSPMGNVSLPTPQSEEVKSPHVGTFFSLVKLGQNVSSGEIIAHIVAMKLPIDVRCEADGCIDAICVSMTCTPDGRQLGTPVEFGQPLFRIRRFTAS